MNYYNEIKKEFIDNELNKKVKDYSKNKYEIQKYCNIGKLLLEAGNNYGDGIIKEYSKKLTNEIGKKYSVRYLFDIRKLYLFSIVHPLGAQLTMSHYRLLFPLNDDNEIDYYINQIIKRNLSKRELERVIKSNEYGRLSENKIFEKEALNVVDFVKCPIQIQNKFNKEVISEKLLQKLILENSKNVFSGNIRISIPLKEDDAHKCNAGLEKLDIKFDGSVLPCQLLKKLPKNIL